MASKAVWIPKEEEVKKTRLYRFMQKLGFASYDSFYQRSVQDIGWFWEEVVKDMEVAWFRPYDRVLDLSRGKRWPRWFVGGKINVAHTGVDKWLADPDVADRMALVWEGEDGAVRRYSYRELSAWINRIAAGLRGLGVGKGDRIAIYLPMISETVVIMLAAAKIGAIFTPAFSGYAADAVATRAIAAGAKLLVTADGFYRRGKVVAMKEEADKVAESAPCVEKVIVVRRLGRDIPWKDGRDVDWAQLEREVAAFPAEELDSDAPLMLLYTSGTTGKPKGVTHIHSGFPIKAAFDAGYCMDVGKGDTLFWYTDMGWMMGPFMVFGALLNGATMFLYEGSPDYPQPDRLWKMVEKHRLTHLGISPTLIRVLMKFGESWFSGCDLSSLRMIGSTGEPWNDEPWLWLFQRVGQGKIPIINYSGGTEISGGILGNVLLKPIAPVGFNGPLPGMDADVFDQEGKPVCGEVGELVLKQPWVGMAHGFWQEPERYEKAYWSRWPDVWVHGDWAWIDEEGFWYITGRSDDTLNVGGKRLGPAEIESVLVGYEGVVEAATIGVQDPVKGEAAVCFAVLKPDLKPEPALKQELLDLVAAKLGKALRPKEIYFVRELPKTRNGKVMRRVLRAAFTGQETGDLSALENPGVLEEIRGLGEEFAGTEATAGDNRSS